MNLQLSKILCRCFSSAFLLLCVLPVASAEDYYESFEAALGAEWATHGAEGWGLLCDEPHQVTEGSCSVVSHQGALPLRLSLESCSDGVLTFDSSQFITGEFSVWVDGLKVLSKTDGFATWSTSQINLSAGDHVIAFEHTGTGRVAMDQLSFVETQNQCSIDQGCHPAAPAYDHVVVVGDSISKYEEDPEAFNYPDYMQAPTLIDNYAVPGTELAKEILAGFAAALDGSPGANGVIIEGGVNDLIWWNHITPTAEEKLQTMQLAMMSMTNEALTRDLDVLFINILPWKTDVWVWSEGKQALTLQYNAWLQRYSLLTGMPLVDAYSHMQSESGEEGALAPEYGGPVHPNEAGAEALAAEVDRLIETARH